MPRKPNDPATAPGPEIPDLTAQAPTGPILSPSEVEQPPPGVEGETPPPGGPSPELAPPKKRRYRRKPEPEPLPLPTGPSEADIAMLGDAAALVWSIVFRIAAAKWGEHWTIQADEYAILKDKWGHAIAPFFEGIEAKYIALGTAVLGTGGMALARFQQNGKEAKRREAATPPLSEPAAV